MVGKNKGLTNCDFPESSDKLKSHLQHSTCQGVKSKSRKIADCYNLESGVSSVNSYKQKTKLRKEEDKYFEYEPSEVNSYAKQKKKSQFVAHNTSKFHPGNKPIFEKEVESRGTNFIQSFRKMHENHHNAHPFQPFHQHENMKLDAPHAHYKVHKCSPFDYDNFAEIDCDKCIRKIRNVKTFENFKVVHGQDKYPLHYSRCNDLKKNKNISINSDFRTVPKEEKQREITKLGNSSNSYISYSNVDNVKLKDASCVKKRIFEVIT